MPQQVLRFLRAGKRNMMSSKLAKILCGLAVLCVAVAQGRAAGAETSAISQLGEASRNAKAKPPDPGKPAESPSKGSGPTEMSPAESSASLKIELPPELRALAPKDTAYAALDKAFSLALAPERKEVAGWHVGKMIVSKTPDQQISSLLTGYDAPKSSASAAGTAALAKSTETVFKVGIWYTHTAGYYDEITPEIKDGIGKLVKKWNDWTSPAKFAATGVQATCVIPEDSKLVMYDLKNPKDKSSSYEVRKYGKFFIVKEQEAALGVVYHYFSRDVAPDKSPDTAPAGKKPDSATAPPVNPGATTTPPASKPDSTRTPANSSTTPSAANAGPAKTPLSAQPISAYKPPPLPPQKPR